MFVELILLLHGEQAAALTVYAVRQVSTLIPCVVVFVTNRVSGKRGI